MGFDKKKFTKLIEMEIIASSILIGFFFTMVISTVEKFRGEEIGAAWIWILGWVSLQTAIVVYAYFTLFLFLLFIGLNIYAFENLTYNRLQRCETIHKWNRWSLIFAIVNAFTTLVFFGALIIPAWIANPLLEIFSNLQFAVLGVFFILVAVKVFSKSLKTQKTTNEGSESSVIGMTSGTKDDFECTVFSSLLEFYSERAIAHASFFFASIFGLFTVLSLMGSGLMKLHFLHWLLLAITYGFLWLLGLYCLGNFSYYSIVAQVVKDRMLRKIEENTLDEAKQQYPMKWFFDFKSGKYLRKIRKIRYWLLFFFYLIFIGVIPLIVVNLIFT